jgi:hypothetical protein
MNETCSTKQKPCSILDRSPACCPSISIHEGPKCPSHWSVRLLTSQTSSTVARITINTLLQHYVSRAGATLVFRLASATRSDTHSSSAQSRFKSVHTPSGTDCFRTLATQHSRVTVSLSTSAVTRRFASDVDDVMMWRRNPCNIFLHPEEPLTMKMFTDQRKLTAAYLKKKIYIYIIQLK